MLQDHAIGRFFRFLPQVLHTGLRMFRVPLDMIAPGMVSAQGVGDSDRKGRTLVPGNEELSAGELSALRSSGVEAIWVRVERLAVLEDAIRDELGGRDSDITLGLREAYLQRLRTTPLDVDVARLRRVWADLFAYLAGQPSAEELIARMLSFDDALAAHALDVSFLSTLVGLQMEPRIARRRRRRGAAGADLHLLTLACLLHDVGKIHTPAEILHKPGKLDRRETREMQRHTTLGYAMLRGKIETDVAEVALHHHQRWDGRGYPRQFACDTTGRRAAPLAGEEIPLFARIAMVVDVFDAATSRRCYREPKPPLLALREMRSQAKGFFEPNLVEFALARVLRPAVTDPADYAAAH